MSNEEIIEDLAHAMVEKILKEREQTIIENFKHTLEVMLQQSVKQLEAELERLKEITKIQLPAPLNAIDIISNGGYVFSNIFVNEYANDFNVKIGGHNVFNWGWSGGPILNKGKYRVTLIVERLSDET